jgi:hypothetical protein
MARRQKKGGERLRQGLVDFVVIGCSDARLASRLLQGQTNQLLTLMNVYQLDP